MKALIQRLLVPSLCVSIVVALGCESQQAPQGQHWSQTAREQGYSDHPPAHWIELMKHNSYQVRVRAMAMLQDYQATGVDTITPLVKILDATKNPSVRKEVARALGKMKAAAAVPVLCKLLKDKTCGARDVLAEELGRIGENAAAAVPALTAALKDESERVREKAAKALGKFKSPGSVAALISLLDDESTTVRAYACDGLAEIGSAAKAALPKLRELAKQPVFETSMAAEEAIRKIGGGR